MERGAYKNLVISGEPFSKPKRSTEKTFTVFTAITPSIKTKLRVAAYCRVSTLLEAQESSILNQTTYYHDLISGNDEWELADIYSDAGLTGKKSETRPELNRMLEDARNGQIDLILTKSISRFARSLTDTLSIVREMKDLGIEIRFEKERISTFSMESEFLLSIYASFAEH